MKDEREIDALITAKADWAWTTGMISELTGLTIYEVRMAKARRIGRRAQ